MDFIGIKKTRFELYCSNRVTIIIYIIDDIRESAILRIPLGTQRTLFPDSAGRAAKNTAGASALALFRYRCIGKHARAVVQSPPTALSRRRKPR